MLQLPHSQGCLVCGRSNPHGLRLDLFVDPDKGVVRADFVPAKHHAGFDELVHGGLIAAVLDEAMTWSATWWQRRFCLCGEFSVRFRHPVSLGEKYRIEAQVDYSRPKLIEASAKLLETSGSPAVTAQGKYLPMELDRHRRALQTLVEDPATAAALSLLK
jgi:acyl-coenzyme A thioesterase PaaI-like protein